MRIFGWSNAKGGVHHYRIREPLRGLALRGHYTRMSPAAVAEIFETYDVVVVRGLHNPHNSLLWRWAAETGKPALRVYDLDDDIWAWRPGTEEDRYWTDERRLEAELNIQCADLVTTPTHKLADILAGLNPNVVVLPNTIPERLLQWLPPHRDRFIVGWQGAQQHIKDLQLIYSSVLRFMLNHSDVEFHVWGPNEILDFPDALAGRIIAHPWTPSVWEHYARLNMDIGLAPIDTTDPFNISKSDVRLREYAALGFPFIASRSEAYSQTANAARGLLAGSPEEWEEALTGLYEDTNMRYWMAEQGRLRARLWTTEGNAIEWERAYERNSNARESTYGTYPVESVIATANGDGNRAIHNIRTERI